MNGTRRSNRQHHEVQTDENAVPTRLVRSKSAQGGGGKALETKTGATRVTRKRPALEDVSNHAAKPSLVTVKADGKSALPVRQKIVSRTSKTDVEKRKPEPLRDVTTRHNKHATRAEEPPTKRYRTIPALTDVDEASLLTKANTPAVDEVVQDWKDLDAADIDDPLMVSEYVVEIFDYLREQELLTLPAPDYMDRQKDLHWKMRSILVDWLVEVHLKFRLLPETLFLAVNIIDRFLSLRVCALPKLQLVGITALFIASKYEEVMCPGINNFVYMADGGYNSDEILNAEQYILQVLEFNLSTPNPMNFLRRVSKADDYHTYVRTWAKYLLEISLVDHRFLEYPPSVTAAAGIYLARYMLDRGSWTPELIHYSGYTEGQIIGCVRLMIDSLSRPTSNNDSIYVKYQSKRFWMASKHVQEWINNEDNVAQFDHIQDTSDLTGESR